MITIWPIIKIIERLLLAMLVGAVAYIVYFCVARPLSVTETVTVPAIKPFSSDDGTIAVALAPYEQYASFFRRDIFSNDPTAADVAANPITPAGQLPSNLRIVGIVLAKTPEIIIEDASARQTYFIRQGQVSNNISFKRVEGNTLWLEYQGQEIAVPVKKNLK